VMNGPLSRVPWYVSTAAVAAAALGSAVLVNVLVSPYFERTFLDEASPLADAPSAQSAGTPVTAAMDAGTPQPPVPTPPDAPAAGVLFRGEVRDGEPGHNGDGTALIIRDDSGALFLRFEEFSVTNGPDLFVILSTDPNGYAGEGAINLGGLKATDGNINYEIPAGVDLSAIRSAVIWCRAFDVDFAVATLEPAT